MSVGNSVKSWHLVTGTVLSFLDDENTDVHKTRRLYADIDLIFETIACQNLVPFDPKKSGTYLLQDIEFQRLEIEFGLSRHYPQFYFDYVGIHPLGSLYRQYLINTFSLSELSAYVNQFVMQNPIVKQFGLSDGDCRALMEFRSKNPKVPIHFFDDIGEMVGKGGLADIFALSPNEVIKIDRENHHLTQGCFLQRAHGLAAFNPHDKINRFIGIGLFEKKWGLFFKGFTA